MGLHRRAKLTVTGRELLVRRIVEEDWPACWAAKMVGVSRATAYKWLARYSLKAWPVWRTARHGRTTVPAASFRRWRNMCWRYVDSNVGGRTSRVSSSACRAPRVYAILVRHGCSRLHDSDPATGKVIRYVQEQPGELIHIDIKKLGRVPRGGGHRVLRPDQLGWSSRGMGCDYLHVAIDDAAGLAYVQALPTERGEAAAQFLQGSSLLPGTGVSRRRCRDSSGRSSRNIQLAAKSAASAWPARPWTAMSNLRDTYRPNCHCYGANLMAAR